MNTPIIILMMATILTLPYYSHAQEKTIQEPTGDQSPAYYVAPHGSATTNFNNYNYYSTPTVKETFEGSKTKLPPTTTELEKNLREQIQFLISSCAYFDKGMESEGKRIAASLHILFANTNGSPSLLEQLRIRDSILLPNTAYKDMEGNQAPFMGLVAMQFGTGHTTPYIAHSLSHIYDPSSAKRILFDEWWRTLILDDHKGIAFTRGAIVIAVAEQDGGVKVASGLEPSYVGLARQSGLGWKAGDGKPVLGVELHSIRQIAWEVLDAISKQYPQYLPCNYSSCQFRSGDSAAQFNIGMKLVERKEYAAGANAFKKVTELSPKDYEAWFNYGLALYCLQEYKPAIDAFKKAIEVKDDYAKAHSQLGATLIKTCDSTGAITHLKRAIELNPYNAIPYMNLGLVQKSQGNSEEATRNISKAFELEPTAEGKDKIKAILNELGK